MKQKNHFLFIIFCLVLTSGLIFTYFQMQVYFSPVKEYQHRLAQMKHQVEKEKLKAAWLNDQLLDYQSYVAKALPKINIPNQDSRSVVLRNIASVSVPKNEEVNRSGQAYMDFGKKFFNKKNFSKAAQNFIRVIENYPASPYVVEAYFLAAESYFMQEDFMKSTLLIQVMMTQFPEHEMTGFAMLRMSQILSLRNRTLEAHEVLDTIMDSFKGNKLLNEQARLSKKQIEL